MVGRWCYLLISSIKTDMRVYSNCCHVSVEASELHFPHLSMLCDNCIQKNDLLLHESWDLSETDIILHAMSWSVCSEVPQCLPRYRVYFLPQALEFWTFAKWKNLLLAPGSKWRTHAQNVFFRWGHTDITHVIKWTRPSSSIFACCKQSETGWWKALLYTKLCPPGNL